MGTVQVDIDGELLQRLRERHPGKTDRELIERLAVLDLGKALFDDSRRMDADPEESSWRRLCVRSMRSAPRWNDARRHRRQRAGVSGGRAPG